MTHGAWRDVRYRCASVSRHLETDFCLLDEAPVTTERFMSRFMSPLAQAANSTGKALGVRVDNRSCLGCCADVFYVPKPFIYCNSDGQGKQESPPGFVFACAAPWTVVIFSGEVEAYRIHRHVRSYLATHKFAYDGKVYEGGTMLARRAARPLEILRERPVTPSTLRADSAGTFSTRRAETRRDSTSTGSNSTPRFGVDIASTVGSGSIASTPRGSVA